MHLFELIGYPPRMEWVPFEIEQKYGEIIDYSGNRFACLISGPLERIKYSMKDEKALIKEFEKLGYKCIISDTPCINRQITRLVN